jgi:ZIP family zinc transporter|tara:strand:+ start:116 stop:910 length:795 start_codon:yes stop_codon:yes gene_type:complete
MEINNIYLGFALATFAGLSTGIGSAIALFTRASNKRFLAIALGLSAGIMIYVSFMEMMQLSFESLTLIYGDSFGKLISVTGFVVGLLLMLLIDQLFDHQSIADFIARSEDKNESSLIKAGVFSAIALAIHNFPEGFATFTATVYDPAIGLTLATAIAVHNIPEGIAVSVPIYYATKSKKKAFYISFLSGLAEPVGAVIGFLIFRTVFNEALFGISFALCAGIMVYVALNELLPVAKDYGEPSDAIIGVTIGMIVMALSLIMMYA